MDTLTMLFFDYGFKRNQRISTVLKGACLTEFCCLYIIEPQDLRSSGFASTVFRTNYDVQYSI